MLFEREREKMKDFFLFIYICYTVIIKKYKATTKKSKIDKLWWRLEWLFDVDDNDDDDEVARWWISISFSIHYV